MKTSSSRRTPPSRRWAIAAIATGLTIAWSCAHQSRAQGRARRFQQHSQGQRLKVRLPEATDASIHRQIHALWPTVQQNAHRFGLDPQLVMAVIWTESRFRSRAESRVGARGLMQIMPNTARGLAKRLKVRPRSLDNPKYNIELGCYYLRRLTDHFRGREHLALAAYHAGPGRVKRWVKTRRSLPRISRNYIRAVYRARAYFEPR